MSKSVVLQLILLRKKFCEPNNWGREKILECSGLSSIDYVKKEEKPSFLSPPGVGRTIGL
jgi:hypothetical protein|tara:strand:+ start:304 stop:483 length:180 start_codon:yes stop_codon:yes gene_type:complete